MSILTNKEVEAMQNALSKHGDVKVLKAGDVFTLFMTGEKLTSITTMVAVQAVLAVISDRYSAIEVMRNEETYFLTILKPVKK